MSRGLEPNPQRPRSPIPVAAVLAVLILTLLVSSGVALARDMHEKTLYQRLGGYDVIAGIVDDFLSRLRDDPAFSRFGGGRSAASLQRTRQLIVDQLCAETGGPCVYIGRDMKTSHQGLKITQAEWDSSVEKLKAALEKFEIGKQEKKEVIDMIQKLRDDIVEKPEEVQAKTTG